MRYYGKLYHFNELSLQDYILKCALRGINIQGNSQPANEYFRTFPEVFRT